MFSTILNMPLPLFTVIMLGLIILLAYYTKKYYKGEKRFLFIPMCIFTISGIISLILRYIIEFSDNPYSHNMLIFIIFANIIMCVLTLIVTGIKQIRQGKIAKEKKGLLLFCIISLSLLSLLIIVTDNSYCNIN